MLTNGSEAKPTSATMQNITNLDKHPDTEELQGFASGRLARNRKWNVLRHVARCEVCTARLQEALDRAGVPRLDVDCEGICRRVLEKSAVQLREAVRDREEGQWLWQTLRAHPPGRRLTIVQSSRRFTTAGVLEALLAEYQNQLWREPREGLALAQLGFAIATRLDPPRYGWGRVADLQAATLGIAGNAYRLLGRSREAGLLLAAAAESLSDGSGDPLGKGQLLAFQGSFWLDARRFEEAERAFRRAENVYREINDLQLAARTLVQRAEASGYLAPDLGIRLTRRAIEEMDPVVDPHLALAAHHHLAWFLEMSGRPGEARAEMRASAALYAAHVGDAIPSLLRHWLAGRIERAHQELEAAKRSLERAWYGFEDLGMAGHLTLLAIDRAEVYTLLGDPGAAAALLHEILLMEWGMPRETARALAILGHSVAAGGARRQAFRQAFIAVWRHGLEPGA